MVAVVDGYDPVACKAEEVAKEVLELTTLGKLNGIFKTRNHLRFGQLSLRFLTLICPRRNCGNGRQFTPVWMRGVTL